MSLLKKIFNQQIILIIIIGFLVYRNALFNAFLWDDETQIVFNGLVHSIKNIATFFSGGTFMSGGVGFLTGEYYKPFMTTAFAMIYTIFGAHSFYFHFFQLILHIINTILVFLFFKYFFDEKKSLFLSLIFLVHPANTESVAYISALQEVLFLFFGLLSIYLVQKGIDSTKKTIFLALLLLFSLFSKETGILFFVMCFVMVLFQNRNPFNVIVAELFSLTIYVVLRFAAFGTNTNVVTTKLLAPFQEMPVLSQLLNIPIIVFSYLKLFFYPRSLHIAQLWAVENFTFLNFYIPLVFLFLFFGASIYLFITYWRNKSLYTMIFGFFFLWFFIGILVHSQIVELDMIFAERWFYFPIIGLLGMIGVATETLFHKRKKIQFFIPFLAAILIIVLSVRTVVRNDNWRTEEVLVAHDIRVDPNNFYLDEMMGSLLLQEKKYDQAMLYFRRSYKLFPRGWAIWNSMGMVYLGKNQYLKAIEYFDKSLEYSPFSSAYENLTITYYKLGQYDHARNVALKGHGHYPYNLTLIYLLAISEKKLGNKDAAREYAKLIYQHDSKERGRKLKELIEENKDIQIDENV